MHSASASLSLERVNGMNITSMTGETEIEKIEPSGVGLATERLAGE
jgi:hypothetical protein